MLHSLCLPLRRMRWTAWDGELSPERDEWIKQRGRGLPAFCFYNSSLMQHRQHKWTKRKKISKRKKLS